MHLTVLLVLAFVFIATVSAANVKRCYNPKLDFYPLLGTRTAYELVHGHGNLKPQSVSHCKPLQIWVLARHGTKYLENFFKPSITNITKFRDQIIKNHMNGLGSVCTQDIENLLDWEIDPNVNDSAGAEIAPQGRKDLLGLAGRLKQAFPELLQVNSSDDLKNDYLFQSTHSQRTQESMVSFIEGLFGDNVNHDLLNKEVLPDNNRLLIPHLNCPAWAIEDREKNLRSEQDAFIKGPEVMEVLSKLTWRLGFQCRLDYNTVYAAYQMCRYEVAWYPDKISPWCTIFDKEDLKVFEYSEDLQYYHTEGPARDMAEKLGCPILADMFTHFEALESGNNTHHPKGIFHFGHSTTIRLFTSALNIGKENTPLTSKTYNASKNRVFRTSKLGPFATNILAVFYRCEEEKTTHKVSFHVAESPLPIGNCENGVCDWELLKKEHGVSTESCNLDFCDNY